MTSPQTRQFFAVRLDLSLSLNCNAARRFIPTDTFKFDPLANGYRVDFFLNHEYAILYKASQNGKSKGN